MDTNHPGELRLASPCHLGLILSFYAVGQPFEEAGESGTLNLPLADTGDWRACSVALQMDTGEPLIRPVPTLSEWGLIAMAGILGVAWFMVVRKSKVTA